MGAICAVIWSPFIAFGVMAGIGAKEIIRASDAFFSISPNRPSTDLDRIVADSQKVNKP